MLVDIEKKLGHRLALDAVAQATLGVGKTGDGLDAIRWWREGKLLDIAEYCCFDVKCHEARPRIRLPAQIAALPRPLPAKAPRGNGVELAPGKRWHHALFSAIIPLLRAKLKMPPASITGRTSPSGFRL